MSRAYASSPIICAQLVGRGLNIRIDAWLSMQKNSRQEIHRRLLPYRPGPPIVILQHAWLKQCSVYPRWRKRLPAICISEFSPLVRIVFACASCSLLSKLYHLSKPLRVSFKGREIFLSTLLVWCRRSDPILRNRSVWAESRLNVVCLIILFMVASALRLSLLSLPLNSSIFLGRRFPMNARSLSALRGV